MCWLLKWFPHLLGFICLITLAYGQDSYLSCGRQKVKTTYFIHKGTNAPAGYWPWHAALFKMNVYQCGGSIIDGNTILTAAHCVFGDYSVVPASQMSVHLGRVHLKEVNNYTQIHHVKKIIVHKHFSENSIIHDIALIKLRSTITMNKYVQTVCLWTMDSKQDWIVGKNGTIVGFGFNEQDVLADQLKQAPILVVDPFSCIQKDRDVFGTHLTWDMFCGIGHAGVGACNGDSGGGMFFEVRGKWFVRGVVSYTSVRGNSDLCDPLKPTAYTDVSKYLEWIKPHINQDVLTFEGGLFEIDYEEKLRLFNFESCGIKSSAYVGFDQMWTVPWLGFARDSDVFDFKCTVTLISEWYAVGPANCFDWIGDESFLIFGDVLEDTDEICYNREGATLCTHPTQRRQIKKVTKHPQYDTNYNLHNIALIELLTPADTTQQNVKPICLPLTSLLRTNEMTNLHVAIHFRTQPTSNIPVRFVETVECIRRYTHGNVKTSLKINRLCVEKVNDEGSSICGSNMPGSPVQKMKLFNGTERYFLHGLDLNGLACKMRKPTIYLNAEPYLDWILFNMKYHTIEATNTSGNSADNQTLESEWNMLRLEPGKEKLHLFNMDTCGISPVLPETIDHVPWIGFLMVDREHPFLYHFNFNSSYQAVLVSEWYALAPKSIVQTDMVWRYLILGILQQKGTYQMIRRSMTQYVEIKKIIIPSTDYSSQTFALIELLVPADLTTPYIQPICLPFMEKLLQLKSTDVLLTITGRTDLEGNVEFTNKKLSLVDRQRCQEKLLWYRVSLLEDNSTCATDPEILRQTYRSPIFGSLFQIHVQLGAHKRYFLYGMTAKKDDRYNKWKYGAYLFDRIELADLEWIVEHTQEKEPRTSFLPSTRNERVNLSPIKVPRSKRSLFNFASCGVSSSSNPTPWKGTLFCRKKFNTVHLEEYKYTVTLISEWYAVGPANVHDSCLNEDEQYSKVVIFGQPCLPIIETEETNSLGSCNPPAHRVAAQMIILHPHYSGISYVKDIALVRLATPANTSLPLVKPICLPILDAIRNYDTSSLVMVHQTLYTYETNITNADERYVDPVKCQERWQYKKVNITINNTNHCLMNQRSLDDECVHVPLGTPLHSRQMLGTTERSFMRGFALDEAKHCSIYFPAVYTNTDAYLEWMLETMEPPQSPEFDLKAKLIFSKK